MGSVSKTFTKNDLLEKIKDYPNDSHITIYGSDDYVSMSISYPNKILTLYTEKNQLDDDDPECI